jgi:GNAT superfamily N-acetyltransferase
MTSDLSVHPVTRDRLDDLTTLFGATKTTSGCFCMWNISPTKQCQAGWSGGNREAFTTLAATQPQPMGVLAYRGDEPVGWAAAGPRSRYARLLGTPLLAARDPSEDASTWIVTCFFVRRDARRAGVTRALLQAAVTLARQSRAMAIEAVPLAGDERHPAGEAFHGVEPLFAGCGFTVAARPSPTRVVMRLDLRPGVARMSAGRGARRSRGQPAQPLSEE